MKATLYLAAALVASALGACADSPAPVGGTDSIDSSGGKSDGTLTTVAFASDWSETVDGELRAGSAIAIEYDLARLTTCAASTHGSEVWGVTGYASFDGEVPVTFAASRISDTKVVPITAELAVPAHATQVAFWFETANVFGCHAYDSNQSANYTFDIAQHSNTAVIDFGSDDTTTLSATIHGGDQVVVHYEPARLSQCAGESGGRAMWGITGHYQIDGGAVKSFVPTAAQGAVLVPTDPTLTIPRGHDLQLWFEATSVWGCHAYDSNLGNNYRFSIE